MGKNHQLLCQNLPLIDTCFVYIFTQMPKINSSGRHLLWWAQQIIETPALLSWPLPQKLMNLNCINNWQKCTPYLESRFFLPWSWAKFSFAFFPLQYLIYSLHALHAFCHNLYLHNGITTSRTETHSGTKNTCLCRFVVICINNVLLWLAPKLLRSVLPVY